MFGFLDKNKKRPVTKIDNEPPIVAPGTEITYKKLLINKYSDEHKKLHGLFNAALTAYQQTLDDEFVENLRHLNVALRQHLLDEELNLYIYLRHCYSHDKKQLELITRFKKNSKKTGVATFAYIKQFTEERSPIIRDEESISELLKIGNMLDTLMSAEEQYLYPIYKKP